MEEVTYRDRLLLAMARKGWNETNAREVGELAGIGGQAVREVLKGRSKQLTAQLHARVARALAVNAYWLATGEESMDVQDLSGLDPLAIDMALVFNEIPKTHVAERHSLWTTALHYAKGRRLGDQAPDRSMLGDEPKPLRPARS